MKGQLVEFHLSNSSTVSPRQKYCQPTEISVDYMHTEKISVLMVVRCCFIVKLQIFFHCPKQCYVYCTYRLQEKHWHR